jgi:hypothetical protein
MPYDGLEFRDPIADRLEQAHTRLRDRQHWISGKYFEEDGRGDRYCVLGALAEDPAGDGCMISDADGRQTVLWLAQHITDAEMSFDEAAKVVYNYNDGYAALEQVSQSLSGLLFMTRNREIDGHGRVLGMLSTARDVRLKELGLANRPLATIAD